MPLTLRRSLPIAGAVVIMLAASARAETPPPDPPPHVRAESPDVRGLVREVSDQSSTARDLIERLQQSDVIVYVRFRWFATIDFDGRIALLSSIPGRRYLVIELACGRSHIVQMVTLAHELHHAVEIADAPEVVDARTLSAHYTRIGVRTWVGPNSEMFETFAARDTAAQVRRELFGRAVRTNERE